MKEKRKILVTMILLLSVICVTVGVTFAAFSFVKQGTVENTIETGTVMLTYTEGKTGIMLNESYPMSDEKGMILTGENNVFDFTVTANLSTSTLIAYEVTAIKIPITDAIPLEDNQVKLYLERAVDPEIEYIPVSFPNYFYPKESQSEIGSPLGSMILDQGTFSDIGTTIHNYRLRMWVDENAEIPNGESRKYGVKINVYAKQVGIKDDESCFTFDEATGTITNYSDLCTKNLKIPSQINGVDVQIIGDRAFWGKGLTSVVIPDTVKQIGEAEAIPPLIDSRESQERIIIIKQYGAFSNNQLTSVTIPDSVVTIGNRAFGNNKLTTLTLGNSVTTIGDYAFVNNQLTSLTIPNSVTTIGKDAFGSNQLTSVEIPNSVTTIGVGAFRYNQLTNVVIGTGVEFIGRGAFNKNYDSNPNLEKIINQTGKEFVWGMITNLEDDNVLLFVTGTIPHTSGDIIVTDTE